MQFIKNGPDVPERLIQAHEEGRVVFFCGAGISYPARLPGFGGLVKKLYDALGTELDPLEQSAFKQARYDTTIGLLEGRVPDGRRAVRQHLPDALAPDLTLPRATQTHEALLSLSQSRKGQCRLVTTNFDRLFESVIHRQGLEISTFEAPFLPVPKNRWNGLVYLHGLLPENPTEDDLNQLVVSSGDFGLAYLTERWAARFVAELFRGYTVCFVGYSINDPVLRYMMDALAADRLMGEEPTETFAFGSYSKGKEAETAYEWESKNVTPILYREYRHHYYLHATLREWANTYRDGVRGKEAIVTQLAMTIPTRSTAQDDFVGRMLWALSDGTGLPAKRFAEYDPPPSLEWLKAFNDRRFRHRDLSRFKVQPNADEDAKLAFSFAKRPTPYTHAAWMAPVLPYGAAAAWDDVMRHISHWLARHLDDPKLLLWIAKNGGSLHPEFHRIISKEISKRHKNGQPLSQPMQRLWRVALAGRLHRNSNQHWDLYEWGMDLVRDGFSPSLRWRFRSALNPYVQIGEPFRLPDTDDAENADSGARKSKRVSDLVRWEIALATDHVHSALENFNESEQWQLALPQLLSELTALLQVALDLMRELEGADDYHDSSYIHQPSISSHSQNRDFFDWTVLIELVRDSWLAAADSQPDTARNEARQWMKIPYPVFRRLAFFAAAQRPDILPPDETLPWLLAEDHRWLWATETQRETIRFLVALAPKLTQKQSNDLQKAILRGPPRHRFRDDLEPESIQRAIDRDTWLRLVKFRSSGAERTQDALAKLQTFNQKYQWQLAPDDQDEFPIWMSDGDEWRKFARTPIPRRDLERWLREHPSTNDFREADDWGERCMGDFPRAATALLGLARQGVWPVDRWSEALRVWAAEAHLRRSWRYAARVLVNVPDDKFKELVHPIAWWLQAIPQILSDNENEFFNLIQRILNSQMHETIPLEGDIVSRSINHPTGFATQAALNWWFRQSLQDNQRLREEIAPIFTDICNPDFIGLRYGCIVLAGNVIALYRVDADWTQKYLLPYFDWEYSDIAYGMWQSFLYSPRLYWPLLDSLKASFLDVVKHYENLGESLGRQYVALLTHAALTPGGTYKIEDFRTAIRQLSAAALAQVANTLFQVLQGAGGQKTEYLENRIAPFMKRIWPKTQAARTPAVSKYFAKLCAVAGEDFPQALNIFGIWLQPTEDVGFAIHLLKESNSCSSYPDEALHFLDMIVPANLRSSGDLRDCLQQMKQANSELEADSRFQRLDQLLRQRGQ